MTTVKPGYVVATYLLEDKESQLKKRAEGIAVGLTVGSWTDLPGTKQKNMQPYVGVIEEVEVVEALGNERVRAKVSIGYPTINFTAAIPGLLTTVFGKLSMDGTIRLTGLAMPDDFVRQFPGPKFGVQGVRERTHAHGRPLLMSIFKSCIGQNLDELTDHFVEQARGGADLIKDDEIFFSESHATPEQRVQRFAKAADEVAQETGKRVQYAVNLTGPVFTLRDRARRLADLGAGALLLNVFAYGYDVLQELAADTDIQIPIMAHPAIAGALYGSPNHGIAANILLGQLMRLAGADIVIYPSPYGSVTLPVAEGNQLVQSLRVSNGLRASIPAPSAGVHPGLVPTLIRDLGVDCIVNAGGGIHGHPDGATAGGKAFVAAIDATAARRSLTDAAVDNPELRKALEKWGEPSGE